MQRLRVTVEGSKANQVKETAFWLPDLSTGEEEGNNAMIIQRVYEYAEMSMTSLQYSPKLPQPAWRHRR